MNMQHKKHPQLSKFKRQMTKKRMKLASSKNIVKQKYKDLKRHENKSLI